jgi:membrane peptidoglycan carboxypeptidase
MDDSRTNMNITGDEVGRRPASTRRPRRPSTAGRRLAIAMPMLLFAAFVALGFVGFVGAVGAATLFGQGLPDPKATLDNLSFDAQTIVYDSTGKVELARFGGERRQVVTFAQLPPAFVDATTSVEDHTFWQNAGFDPVAIVSAGLDSLRGRSRGASTITQQLVRARLLPDSVLLGSTYERKIKEIIQSIRLTEDFPNQDGKQEIFAAYVNQNFYGNQSYGVAAAAQSYFGVTDLKKLTLAQMAVLAAIPQSPTNYDLVQNADTVTGPDGKPQLIVPATAPIVVRRNFVLDQMKQYRMLTAPGQPSAITDAQLDAAKAEPLVLAPQKTTNWRAPQFVLQVRNELGRDLCPQSPTRCDRIDTAGYVVKTSLNYDMQKIAEKWVKAAVLGPNAPNTAAYLKSLGIADQSWIEALRGKKIHNGALIALDYRTGRVLAYVGSADYYASKSSPQFQPKFDVLADGWRQPGSSFKPINYITGFEAHTLTPASLFMDVTTDFGGGYVPTDADLLERGPVRLREALMFSLNIPAVKAAAIDGPDQVFAMAIRMGVKFQSKTNPAGASIGIGTVEVHPADLASAYGAIADGGQLAPRTTVISVTDSSGNAVWPPASGAPQPTQVVSPQAAYLVTNILASNTDPAQNPYWGKNQILQGPDRRPATLKTGTTNDTKDLMAFGYLAPPANPSSPGLVVGAWMGNSDNSRTGGVFSLEGTAPLWQAFLTEASAKLPIADFHAPSGITTASIDAYTGLAAGPGDAHTVTEAFIDGTAPAADTAGKCVALSSIDAAHPAWQQADDGWLARAQQGPGVRGGPAKGTKTATAYFYEPAFQPFGATWGPSFNNGSCNGAAVSASPSGSPSASPSESASRSASLASVPPSVAPSTAPPSVGPTEPTPEPTPEPTAPPTPEPTPVPTPEPTVPPTPPPTTPPSIGPSG